MSLAATMSALLPSARAARLTCPHNQSEYARSIALVAVHPGTHEMLGAVRLHADANYEKGEYGILVRSDLKGSGLGRRLMDKLIAHLKARGTQEVVVTVLRANTGMLELARKLGFVISDHPGEPHEQETRYIRLDLQA